MIRFICFAGIALVLLSCSSVPVAKDSVRKPSSQVSLREITKATEGGRLCDAEDLSGACLVTWDKAVGFCKANHTHLPTAPEYAAFLQAFGIQVLTPEQFAKSGLIELKPADVFGPPRKNGFYRVPCAMNADGSDPTFYMNDFNYVRPAGLPGNHKIWTATSPPGHPEAVHVLYDQWGGGGGKPSEHLKSQQNSFRCADGP